MLASSAVSAVLGDPSMARPSQHGRLASSTQAGPLAPGGFDHTFCLSDAPVAPRVVAELTGASGLSLQVATDQPGLQVYDGAHFDGLPGLDGRRYHQGAGIALETQGWPDAVNRPTFPDPILRPGQTYRHHVAYRFAGPAGR